MTALETKKTDWKRLKISASLIATVALFINLLTLPQSACLAENSPEATQNKEEAKKHFNKGVDLQNAGFFNQALAEYKTARSLDDKMEEALGNSGIIYAEQKSYKHATEMFESALRIKPNSPTVLNALGSVLYSRGKIDEAKQKWNQATEADPKFAAAYFNMAVAYETEHKNLEAVEQYTKVIHLNPKMGEAFYRLATIYLKDRHLAQARVMYATSLALGQDAEYFRDAKKQLAAIDEEFAN